MSEADKKTEAKKTAPREVLFFELEYIATAGRQALFDAVKNALKTKDIEVTPVSFSRSGIAPRPAASVRALVEASGKNLSTVDQLADQAEGELLKFFAESATVTKELPALIKAAQARNIQVVAISAWSEKIAGELMKKLGLDELNVQLEAFNCADEAFPRADHWLRMVKDRGQDTLPLIAIVSSHVACKGALTAGAVCVSIPDTYTSFEDFAGSQLVLDSLGEMKAEEILDLVCRR